MKNISREKRKTREMFSESVDYQGYSQENQLTFNFFSIIFASAIEKT